MASEYLGTIRPKDFIRTCTACPAQWEGTLTNGHMIYVRYRHGHFSVCMSDKPTKDVLDCFDGIELIEDQDCDEWGGWMSEDEMICRITADKTCRPYIRISRLERLFTKLRFKLEKPCNYLRNIWYNIEIKTWGKKEHEDNLKRLENLFKPKGQ